MSRPCRNCGGVDRYKSGHCKACHDKHVRNWNKKHPERLKSTKAAWAKANVEKQRVWYRRWRAQNPEAAYAATRAWREANPEKVRAAWLKSAEDRRVWKHAYYVTHHAEYRVYVQNRLRRIRESGGRLSRDIVARLQKSQQNRCRYCSTSLDLGYHIDHIMPVALGGAHADDNIQLLCPQCNLKKGAKHPDQFLQETRNYAET